MSDTNYTLNDGTLSTVKNKKSKYKKKRPHGFGHVVTYKNRASPYVAFYKDEYGAEKTKSFKTPEEAEKFLDDLFMNRGQIQEVIDNGISFEAYVPIFENKQKEKERKGKLKSSSLQTKKRNLDIVNSYLGKYKLTQINNSIVEHQLIDELWKKNYSKSVMQKAKSIVIDILRSAAADGYIQKIPVLDFAIPEAKHDDDADDTSAESNYLHEDELKRYVNECKKTYVAGRGAKNKGKVMPVHITGYRLLFLLHTGLRLSEALALTWEDFDDFSKTLMIDKNLVHTKAGKILQTPKTEAGKRLIVLNKEAYSDIIELRKQFDLQSIQIDTAEQNEIAEAESTFSGQDLRSKKREISHKFKDIRNEHRYICGGTSFPYGSGAHGATLIAHRSICKAIGLNHNVTVHGLRHTYVTHYYLNHCKDPDFDLVLFSKSIGHASVRTTLEIYAHLNMVESRTTQRNITDLKDF